MRGEGIRKGWMMKGLVYTDIINDGIITVHTEILQETHYYPFGLEFQGHYIQQSGFDYRYKYNDIERLKDLDVGIDMAFYRGLDATTGRWMQVDPKAEHDISTSPYVAHYNSPINFSDPLGDCPFCPALSQMVAALSAVNLSTILPAVTITASAATSASVLSSASVAARGAVAVATLPTLTQSFVLPQYDQWIESGYTTAPYQRYTFFESEPGNSGRTMHVEHTLRSNDQGDLSIKNTFYRWYDSFELLEKLGGPTGVVEMVPNLIPVKAAGSSISKSLALGSWTAAKMRYWKLTNGGKVPTGKALVQKNATGEIIPKNVSKELHHKEGRTGPDPHRFSNLKEVWPWEHQAIDKYRHTGYEFIKWIK